MVVQHMVVMMMEEDFLIMLQVLVVDLRDFLEELFLKQMHF